MKRLATQLAGVLGVSSDGIATIENVLIAARSAGFAEAIERCLLAAAAAENNGGSACAAIRALGSTTEMA